MIADLQMQRDRLYGAINRCVDVAVTIDGEHTLELLPRGPYFTVSPTLFNDTPIISPSLYAPVPMHPPLLDISIRTGLTGPAAPPLPIPHRSEVTPAVIESTESPSPLSSISSISNSAHTSHLPLPRSSRSTTRHPASSMSPTSGPRLRRTTRNLRSDASSSNLTTAPPRRPSNSPSPPRRRRRVRSPLVEAEEDDDVVTGMDADLYDEEADSNMTGEP